MSKFEIVLNFSNINLFLATVPIWKKKEGLERVKGEKKKRK